MTTTMLISYQQTRPIESSLVPFLMLERVESESRRGALPLDETRMMIWQIARK